MGKIIKDSNGKVLMNSNGGAYEVTAAIDSNIVPNNIKKDVSILGVTGTLEVIEVDGMDGFLSVESKTIPTSASQTTNITYNKNCGILDENYKKWDTLAWHQRWVDNGYSATGLSKPIGIWMKAFGFDMCFLWPITDDVGYSDLTGSITPTTSLAMGLPSISIINSKTTADRTVWPANQSGMIAHGTAGKYKSATFRTVDNGDGLDMICDNTLETFTIPSRDVGNATPFKKFNNEDYTESYYQQCEFFRSLFAICSGISTTQSNGTKTTVEILNVNGQQAAVNEDMYFWIGGTNTSLLAKYNLNCNPSLTANVTTGLLTQTIADAIYNKQVANGVNMNDTGVNSSSKPTLYDGMKGAEAVAVDGYWYIKTPYISQPHVSSFTANYNVADAPAAYVCKKRGIYLQPDMYLCAYRINRDNLIEPLVSMLKNKEQYEEATAPWVSLWSAIRGYVTTHRITVDVAYGGITASAAYSRCTVIPTLPKSTLFTT